MSAGPLPEEARLQRVLSLDLRAADAQAALIQALYDESFRVRGAAAERLAQLPAPAPAAAELLRVLGDRAHPGARNAAAHALAALGEGAVDAVLSLLSGHADPDQRKLAADILGEARSSRAVLGLVSALADPDENVSGAAAEALGQVGGEGAVAALQGALTRGAEYLKACALDALVQLGAPPPWAVLEPLLQAPSLRRSAYRAVALHREPAAIERLAAAVRSPSAPLHQAGLSACGLLALRGALEDRRQLEAALRTVAPSVERAPEAVVSALGHEELERRAGGLMLAAALGDAQPVDAVAESAADDRLAPLAVFALQALGHAAARALSARAPSLSSAARAAAKEALAVLGVERAASFPTRHAMTEDEFAKVRDLVHARSGIFIREDLKYVMERRLWPRLEALGLSDFAAYEQHLAVDPRGKDELDLAVEALATNETYFFREKPQLAAFSEELLPVLAETNRASRRLRVWSAGCSTGEEPYTIAMLVKESGLFEGWDVQVLGTDLSRKVLAAARHGEFGPSSMRAMPEGALQRHFEPAGDRHRVRPEIRSLVTFGHLNLMDEQARPLVGRQDVIFCRNVLIYFDLPARKQVVEFLYDRLVEGGHLLLGHAESLISLTAAFELVHLTNDLVYRRPAAAPGGAA